MTFGMSWAGAGPRGEWRGQKGSYPAVASLSLCRRLQLSAKATRCHSPATLSRPRSEKPVKPRTALMMPNTGSTVCWRSLSSARPGSLASFSAALGSSTMPRFGRRGFLSALGGSLCAATSLSLSAGGARGAVKSFIALGGGIPSATVECWCSASAPAGSPAGPRPRARWMRGSRRDRAEAAGRNEPNADDALAPWRLRDLRRSVVTHMAEIGIQPHVIEAVVNHISGHKGGVAGVYNRATYAAEKRAALDRWAAWLLSTVAGGDPAEQDDKVVQMPDRRAAG